MMTTRLWKVLRSIRNQRQVAFVLDEHLQDHILLVYELIRGYTRKGETIRCMMLMDLQKAYDTMDWISLESILKELGFPTQFIRWIMLVMTTNFLWILYKWRAHQNFTGQDGAQTRRLSLPHVVCHSHEIPI